VANYPGSLDSLTNPASDDTLASVPHHTQHATANDILEALEARLGYGTTSTPVLGATLMGTGTGTSRWKPTRTVVVEASGGDDLTALQAAAATEGTRIILRDPLYLLSAEWHIDQSNIYIEGAGAVGTGATVIRRSAAGSGAVIRWGAPAATTYPPGGTLVHGGGARNLQIDANGDADHALHVHVADRLIFEDVWLLYADVACLYMDTITYTSGDVDNYNRNAFCEFRNVRAFLQTSGYTLNPDTAKGFVIAGSASNTVGGMNTYACTFTHCYTGAPDIGVQINDADDLQFFGCYFNGSYGVELNGSSGVANARNVHFFGGIAGGTTGTVIARATGMTNPSRDNTWTVMGNEDTAGTMWPVIEPGAGFRWARADGTTTVRRDNRTSSSLHDDFHTVATASGSIGALGWSGGATLVGYTASTAGHLGINYITCAASIGAKNSIYLGPNALLLPSVAFDAAFIVGLYDKDSDTGNRVGFTSDPTAALASPASDGIYFEKLAADTNWFAVCRASGTQTRTDTGIATTSLSYVHLRIRRASASRIEFTIGNPTNQQPTVSTSTNVPTAALGAFFSIETAANTAKRMNIDLFDLEIIGQTRWQ
jgi:hypothetical protein